MSIGLCYVLHVLPLEKYIHIHRVARGKTKCTQLWHLLYSIKAFVTAGYCKYPQFSIFICVKVRTLKYVSTFICLIKMKLKPIKLQNLLSPRKVIKIGPFYKIS